MINCKRVDFLIYYETVQREYEDNCLLKAELERRGYSVMICNTLRVDFWKSFFVRPEVIIVPGFYGGRCIQRVLKMKKRIDAKIVNLQYEQIVSLSEEGNNTQMPLGDEKNAYHVCWGEQSYKSCLKNGVSSEHLLRMGAMQFDLLRKEFSDYFLSRENICMQYNIHPERKIILFISDFAFITYGQGAYDMLFSDLGEEARDVIEYEKKSYDYIIGFIMRYIKSHPEVEFIYRPHPSELNNEQLEAIAEDFPNFHIIVDLNIKQWIKISDKINTWNSTAISEVYFAKKPCLVVDIPKEELTPAANNYRIRIIDDGKKATTYDEFEEWNDTEHEFNDNDFPINHYYFDSYYGYTEMNTPVYKKICDKLETIFMGSEYLQPFRKDSTLKERIKQLRQFRYTLRGNIRLVIFPIINYFFSSKCRIDKYLAQHNPKALLAVYSKIKVLVENNNRQEE